MDAWERMWRSIAAAWKRTTAERPKPAPSRTEIVSRPAARRTVTPAEFEVLVAAHAKVLAGGGPVSALHYALARQQVRRDLAARGVAMMDGERAEAAREAGGADKL